MNGNWKMVRPEYRGRRKVRYYLAYGSNLGALLPGLRQQFEHVPDAGALPGSKAQRLGEDP